jgi:hypothetical protein
MKKEGKKKKARQKRARRREAGRQLQQAGRTSALTHVRRARNYPIEGCWVREDWHVDGLAVVVIARRQPDGNLVFGVYLVDCLCLGLKNTYFNANVSVGEFYRESLPQIFHDMSWVDISPALAHEIIYGGIAYAEQLGFRPQRDFRRSQYILDLPDEHPPTGTVEFGRDGKPLYVSGPDDNVQAVLRQLDRAVGEGNYQYIVGIDGPQDVP